MDKRQFIQTMGLSGMAAMLPARVFGQTTRTLRMGLTVAPTSMDPHFHDNFTATQALWQIYQTLVGQDDRGALIPYIATSWQPLDDNRWEIKLREGVTFHDGTLFEPEDIIFSFERVPVVPNAIGRFTANVRDVKKIDIIDRHTVQFTLGSPDPLFAYKLCQVAMLSRTIHANAELADFNSGKAAIGMGPYKFVSFTPGEQLTLAAYEGYWGGKPDWDRVEIRYITEAGSRIAALRAGEFDLIDNVPVQDIANIQSDPNLALFSQDAFLIAYFTLDVERDVSPFVRGVNGEALDKNPLKDVRVRRALSMSIDRQALVDRLLQGQGRPANQLLGVLPPDRVQDMPPLPYDVNGAKALLQQAGWGDGFQLTIHAANGWFSADSNIAQAVAQSFSRIGVRTLVEILPPPVIQSNVLKQAYSFSMIAFNASYAIIILRWLAMRNDPEAGNGIRNIFNYYNETVEQAMQSALVEMDTDKRHAYLATAMRAVVDDMAYIPILGIKTNWAGRKNRLVYQGNPTSRSSAYYAKPV